LLVSIHARHCWRAIQAGREILSIGQEQQDIYPQRDQWMR
jgi:hypothetical protein